jgi:hypothetical protein
MMRLRSFIIAVACMSSTATVAADWQIVADFTPNGKYLIDFASVKRDGTNVTFWTRFVEKPNIAEQWDMRIDLMSIDCLKATYRILETHYYINNNPNGHNIKVVEGRIIPDSSGDIMRKALCPNPANQ